MEIPLGQRSREVPIRAGVPTMGVRIYHWMGPTARLHFLDIVDWKSKSLYNPKNVSEVNKMQSSKFIGGERDKFVKLSVLTGWKRKLSLIMHLEIMHLEETYGEVPPSRVPRSKLCAGYDSNSFAPSGDIQCH